MIKSGQNFANATTAQLSWHQQNCNLIRSLSWKYEARSNNYSQKISIINQLTICEMIPKSCITC